MENGNLNEGKRHMNLKEILGKLKNVKSLSNGYQACCPVHDDHKESLSISENDGKVLIYCHAGCETEHVLEALDLKMSDLFISGVEPKTKVSNIIKTYDYHDEEGHLLYQVCRTSEKKYFQRRPDGKGGYDNGLGEVKRVLYRLPELTEAVKDGKTIFIPEGEKDVDNLIERGLSATCNPMGAGKWKKDYADYLKKADVVILPDNDDAGIKHSTEIGESLQKNAQSVKVLLLPDLPKKGDVSDWLEAGNSVEKLVGLAAKKEIWESGQEKDNKKSKEEKDIVYTSFYADGERLYEQINVEGVSKFAMFDHSTGKIKSMDKIETDDEIIKPLSGEDIKFGAVKLPSGISEYKDTLNLLEQIKKHIYKYLDLSDKYLQFAAYYILMSWLYDLFHTVPYLRALGDTGCGKSRFLDVIGGLTYKSISASGCVTPAPIYRMLRRWQGSLVLDEADMKGSDEYNEVVTILNCGFEKNRPVIRSNKDKPDNVQILPVYGPKVFATRQRFQDAALEARCLTEIMRETDRSDISPVLNKEFFEEQEILRRMLLLYRLRNYRSTTAEAPLIDLGEIEPRLRQISQPFLALFSGDEKILNSYIDFIRGHQEELIEQRAGTITGMVVEKLFDLVSRVPSDPLYTIEGEKQNTKLFKISAGDIAEELGNITPQKVGSILKGLGIKTHQIKVDGKSKRCIIEDEKEFSILQKRYISKDKRTYKIEELEEGNNNSEITANEEIDETEDCGSLRNQWVKRNPRTQSADNQSADGNQAVMINEESDDDDSWIDVEEL